MRINTAADLNLQASIVSQALFHENSALIGIIAKDADIALPIDAFDSESEDKLIDAKHDAIEKVKAMIAFIDSNGSAVQSLIDIDKETNGSWGDAEIEKTVGFEAGARMTFKAIRNGSFSWFMAVMKG